MLPLGHVAYTWALLGWLQSRQTRRAARAPGQVPAKMRESFQIDYRAAAAAALLPDLVDKPLSLTLLSNSGTSQGLAHTLVAHVLLTLLVARLQPAWLPYALISNSHLLADQMWKYRQTLFFPFSGRLNSWRFMGSPAAMLSAYAEIVTRPSILSVELLGLALLACFVRQARLYRLPALKRFLATGKLMAKTAQGA